MCQNGRCRKILNALRQELLKVLQAASFLLLVEYIPFASVAVEQPWAGVFQVLAQRLRDKW